jgi:SAM-dependent methyltransferase
MGKVAGPVSSWARRRRLEQLLELTGIGPTTRIVDVGCGGLGLLGLAPDLNVTGVDLYDRPEYPGRLVRADATERLPFSDQEFDLAYANSVIEHIAPGRREAFASEVRRVARGWWVQTPAVSFPIEPHALLPGAHWLPLPLRRHYWKLGAGSDVDEIQLLPRRELEVLFGPAFRERLGPFTKSWIAFRAPTGR